MSDSPYADAYADYWRAGWRGILPLPYGAKHPPPGGYTGYDALTPSYADCATWADGEPQNLALHLPDGIIGIDVDHYDGKGGGDTLNRLTDDHGPLPPTWRSTSRDDGISGILLYRVPPGTVLPTKLPGIEFIQHFHRYVVAWPSRHPGGGTYRWINPGGDDADAPPAVADLPDLPPRWLAGLATERQRSTKADLTTEQALAVLAEMPDGDPCDHLLRHAGKAMAGGDRHDTYNEATLAVVGAGRRGCPGAVRVVKRLQSAFIAETSDRQTRAEAAAEYGRGLVGALAIVAHEPQGTVCPDDVLDWLDDTPTTDTPSQANDDDSGEVEPTPYDLAVRRRYAELRINDDAREMLAALRVGDAPPLDGLTLAAFLDQPDDPARYRVEGLWPAEGRVLLAAAAKTGKTTMVAANLIPALVDGREFLGGHDVQLVTGTVALLNMEVGERTMRRWLRDAGIAAADRVILANLRGKASALGLGSTAGRRRTATWLRDHGAEVVILDPLAPVLASLGLDENANADVARFFGWWAEVMDSAGVADDLVVHHTGHAGERSRGASRLLDEPDAIWTLTKDAEADSDTDDPYGPVQTRYLAAYGRDVDLPAQALAYDPPSRGLYLTGLGKSAVREASRYDRDMAAVVAVFADRRARTRNAICDEAKGGRSRLWKAVERMIETGDLERVGKVTGGPTYLPRTLMDIAP